MSDPAHARQPLASPRYHWLEVEPGRQLRVAHWPAAGAVRGQVLLLQGLSEFVEKYQPVAQELLARGFEVWTFDWRGQGQSFRYLEDPRKAHVPDFSAYDADLAAVLRFMPAAHERCAVAHSMGGHIALRHLRGSPQSFRRLILTSPMLGIHTRPWPQWAARLAARGLLHLGLAESYLPDRRSFDPLDVPFEGNPFTSDPVAYAREQELLRADPRLVLGAVTVGWLDAAFRSLRALWGDRTLPALQVPMHVLAAEDERIVSTPATRRFVLRLPRARFEIVPGARHEVLNERLEVRAAFWRVVDAACREAG